MPNKFIDYNLSFTATKNVLNFIDNSFLNASITRDHFLEVYLRLDQSYSSSLILTSRLLWLCLNVLYCYWNRSAQWTASATGSPSWRTPTPPSPPPRASSPGVAAATPPPPHPPADKSSAGSRTSSVKPPKDGGKNERRWFFKKWQRKCDAIKVSYLWWIYKLKIKLNDKNDRWILTKLS